MGYEDQTKGQLINELKELRQRLSGLEETADKLTGLYNREYFLDLAECEFIRSKRFQRPLSVILVCIKDFDQIKAKHNATIADIVLAEVAARCKIKIRDLDYFGRYDDDKLVLLLPEADKSAVQKIAERLQEAVSVSPIRTEGANFDITLCQGGVEVSENYPVLEEFLSKAEEALRSAKQSKDTNIVVK
jgi:diguanylate cyclase (GGDEF)-like protein